MNGIIRKEQFKQESKTLSACNAMQRKARAKGQRLAKQSNARAKANQNNTKRNIIKKNIQTKETETKQSKRKTYEQSN